MSSRGRKSLGTSPAKPKLKLTEAKKRSRSPEGKCIFHETDLVEGSCVDCLKDNEHKRRKKLSEDELFDQVGFAKSEKPQTATGSGSSKGARRPPSPQVKTEVKDKPKPKGKSMCRRPPSPSSQPHITEVTAMDIVYGERPETEQKDKGKEKKKTPPPKGKIMTELSQAEKEFSPPERKEKKCKQAGCHFVLKDSIDYSEYCAFHDPVILKMKADKEAKSPKPKSGGKGAPAKLEGAALEVWQKRLDDLPEVVMIVCDERDDDEPLLVFSVEKKLVSPEQLSWLEMLRGSSKDSPSRVWAERKIAELLFGFKEITEAREAIETKFLDDDACEDVEEAMAIIPKKGAWYDEYHCNVVNPEAKPEDDTDNDMITSTNSERFYRLRHFWENFTQMLFAYEEMIEFDKILVAW